MINIVLFQPEIPQNTGNIMRTCVAFDFHLHIIGPITFSLDEKSLKRAGMDYIKNLKMTLYENYEEYLKVNGKKLTYFITRYGSKTPDMANFKSLTEDIYVMFGRESTGIPHEILRNNDDYLIRIPMVPNARSLNLSNTVSIIGYEILRQQNYFNLSTNEALKGSNFLKKEIGDDE